MTGTKISCAGLVILVAYVWLPVANADYYFGYRRPEPIISLELNEKESLNSSFRIAVREERLEDAERFLHAGADINAASDSGMTALMYAAQNCSQPVVRFLILSGAYANARDEKKRTALMYAANESCLDVVRFLLKVPNIDVFARDSAGRSTEDYAIGGAALDVAGPASRIVELIERKEKAINQAGKKKRHLSRLGDQVRHLNGN